ncbi:MAG: hypothetical protein FWG66_09420 [Spirochaetes bacterium]|nr:hypothetical protein [Spirochaetota bacterium]
MRLLLSVIFSLSLALASLFFVPAIAAQDAEPGAADSWDDFFDWDIDAIFGGDADAPIYIEIEDADVSPVLALIRRPGVTFEAAFDFRLGTAPGWSEAPWFSSEDRSFTWAPGFRMRSDFALDAQLSEWFRVRTSFYFTVPHFSLSLNEFFLDYNLQDQVFFRAGKSDIAWGISPNFAFSNLVARVPAPRYDDPFRHAGSPYIMRADIPIGVGGIQLLALTRVNLLDGIYPGRRDIAYGGRYNLALPLADFELGAFHQEGMPVRGIFSINTTILNTEFYSEWLLAVDPDSSWETSMAFNIGFVRGLFDNRLFLNGELFYNAESNAYWFREETAIRDAEVAPFVEGLNTAANILYSLGGRGNPRVFLQMFYAPLQNTAQLVPGFILNPFPHAELIFALPMALGRRDGHYYRNPIDVGDLNRPFSISLMLSIRGSIQVAQFF